MLLGRKKSMRAHKREKRKKIRRKPGEDVGKFTESGRTNFSPFIYFSFLRRKKIALLEIYFRKI